MFLGVSEFEMPCEENHMLLIFEKKILNALNVHPIDLSILENLKNC